VLTSSSAISVSWITVPLYKHILWDVLLCFYKLCVFWRAQKQTTSKHSQRYYTTKRLTRDLLSNSLNCFFRNFNACALRENLSNRPSGVQILRDIWLGVICTLRSAVRQCLLLRGRDDYSWANFSLYIPKYSRLVSNPLTLPNTAEKLEKSQNSWFVTYGASAILKILAWLI